jgi:hypothetical protein
MVKKPSTRLIQVSSNLDKLTEKDNKDQLFDWAASPMERFALKIKRLEMDRLIQDLTAHAVS